MAVSETDGELQYGRARAGTTELQLIVDGDVVATFDLRPSLAALRAAQRDYAPRLDLYDAGLQCPLCQGVIDEDTRFAAVDDTIMCRECANIQDVESPAESDLSVTHDPTKSVLGESDLSHKRLIDYNINVATGCAHGCSFCYVPSTPQIATQQDRLQDAANVEDSMAEWGDYILYRDDAPERLRRELQTKASSSFDSWNESPEGQGIVGLSFHTDCYMSRRAADITRACIRELVHHDRHVRVLTRSPNLTRDIDLFREAGDLITVGVSIPTLDDAQLGAIETTAPPPSARFEAMQEVAEAGVNRYISMGPTLPTQDREDLRNLLQQLATLDPDVIFHEPLNPRGDNFERTVAAARSEEQHELAAAIEDLADKRAWREYAVNQLRTVHELSRELELPVYCWPTRELLNGDYSEYAQWWRAQESPETFAGRDPDWDIPPAVPDSAPNQLALSQF